MPDLIDHCAEYATSDRAAERLANDIQAALGTQLDRYVPMVSDDFQATMEWCEAWIVTELDVSRLPAGEIARRAVAAWRYARDQQRLVRRQRAVREIP